MLPGRRRGEAKAEAGGYPDSWCVRDRSVRLVVLARILVPIVLVPIVLVPIVLVQIPRAWGEKKQAGDLKGVPCVEQYPQDGGTRGRLVSAGRSVGRSVDWGEASRKSETVAWVRT